MNLKINKARRKRKGITAVYVAMLLPILMGVASLAVDVSWLYARKAVAQKAADASALAGAWQLANFHSADADGQAIYYAGLAENGGYRTADGATITINKWDPTKPVNQQTVEQQNWFKVTVKRPEPTFFAGIFGAKFKQVNVSAYAVAIYETLAELNIKGGGVYGKAPGPVNLSLFGPDGFYNNGDCYSVRKLPDGTANPLYNGVDSTATRKGYDFAITIPQSFKDKNSTAYFQIFDPDCYNKNNTVDADGSNSIDEMRKPDGSAGTAANDATTTQYTLYRDNGTTTTADDTIIFQKSYGNQSDTDMIWNDFYAGNPNYLNSGEGLRLNVLSTAGSSENGFDLRVSDKPALAGATQRAGSDNFDPNNGTVVSAEGHMPMNFNTSGSVTVTLGTIPIQAANGQMTIRKFDTDVGAKAINYFCNPKPSNQPAAGYPGVLASNGTFASDTISLPADYKGGTWTAVYAAGTGDTSVWDMSYSNYGPGAPGGIKLIR